MGSQMSYTKAFSSLLSYLLSSLSVLLLILPLSLTALVESDATKAKTYGEWKEWQAELDELRLVNEWRQHHPNRSYNWQTLASLKHDLESRRHKGDVRGMGAQLLHSASRNICGILNPALYRRSRTQTKKLIHSYVSEVLLCLGSLKVGGFVTNPVQALTLEDKRTLLRSMRQALGRTTLVLQGGALLSMCHVGVVKALYRQRLLPKIITGTSTGSLIAALVATTRDEDLLQVLEGRSMNLSAFDRARMERKNTDATMSFLSSSWRAVVRRIRRWVYYGHFFNLDVLTLCVQDHVGNVTFEEAHAKTGRILNITIAIPDVAGTPQLLNYITAPHVLIWSAVVASITTSTRMYAPARLYCKNDVGTVTEYFAVDASNSVARYSVTHQESPLERIGELFNVNHYIVSQTRPYIIPFVRLQQWAHHSRGLATLVQVVYNEVLHWLRALSYLQILPALFRRSMIDEIVPSSVKWSKFVIAPSLSLSDYLSLFDFPTTRKIDELAWKGEKSVWPRLYELEIRCRVEFELDDMYEQEILQQQAHQRHSSI